MTYVTSRKVFVIIVIFTGSRYFGMSSAMRLEKATAYSDGLMTHALPVDRQARVQCLS